MEAQKLVHEWAEATGNILHHGETLRSVSVDDLVELVLAVERAIREQPGIVQIKVHRYRTPKGEPTCCAKFTEGHFCRFLGRRNFGAEWVCMLGETKPLSDRDEYLQPHSECEVWRNCK